MMDYNLLRSELIELIIKTGIALAILIFLDIFMLIRYLKIRIKLNIKN